MCRLEACSCTFLYYLRYATPFLFLQHKDEHKKKNFSYGHFIDDIHFHMHIARKTRLKAVLNLDYLFSLFYGAEHTYIHKRDFLLLIYSYLFIHPMDIISCSKITHSYMHSWGSSFNELFNPQFIKLISMLRF